MINSVDTTNPFAAPGVQELPTQKQHWRIPILKSGLRFCLIGLCIGIGLAILRALTMLAFGTNANSLWLAILICLELGRVVTKLLMAIGCYRIFKAAPTNTPRILAGVVLALSIVVPIWNIVSPLVVSRLFDAQTFGWFTLANSVLTLVFTLAFLSLMRTLGKRFERKDMRGIASLSMGIHTAMAILPIVSMANGLPIMNTGGTAVIYLCARVGLVFVNAVVVYLLYVYIRDEHSSVDL